MYHVVVLCFVQNGWNIVLCVSTSSSCVNTGYKLTIWCLTLYIYVYMYMCMIEFASFFYEILS